MNGIVQDVRGGLRQLRRGPGFCAAAVATLALGIGANTAIFSVVEQALLRPLPYAAPDDLVMVWDNNPAKGWDRFSVSPANFPDWEEQATSFAGLFLSRGASFTLTGSEEPELLSGTRLSVNAFEVLGLPPALGRGFLPSEGVAGGDHVVVLSHGLWKRRFGSDPSVVGRSVALNGEPYMVVGVAARQFTFLRADVYAPFPLVGDDRSHRGWHNALAFARLAPGATVASASAEMTRIADRLAQAYPDSNAGWGAYVVSLREQLVGDSRPALLLLLAAVALVLLIACANVASLILARGLGRGREIAIRAALGAGRGRIVRQLLTESLLLASLGGLAGLVIAAWGVDLIVRSNPGNIPGLRDAGIDTPVAAFTLGISLLTGLLSGLYPALATSRGDLCGALREGGRSGGGTVRRAARQALVVAEMAIAVVLLIGAGLALKSFGRLVAVSPGFEPGRVLLLSTDLPRARYPGPEQQERFYGEVLERLRANPAVEAAGAVSYAPLAGGDLIQSFDREGHASEVPGQSPSANYYAVTPDYFRALGIPLRRGRGFAETDGRGEGPVAIVDETFVRRFLPGEDPIGKRLRFGNDQERWREIVGVVGAVTHYSLERGTNAAIYEPYAQNPMAEMSLVLRTRSDPASLAAAAKAAVYSVDADQPVSGIRTMDSVLDAAVAPRRFPMALLAIFAGVAVLLSLVGLAGLVSYAVSQRTHEIGVRLALGAEASDIVRLVVGEGTRLALAGIALGLVGAVGLSRFAAALLFGVSAVDLETFAVVPLLLTLAALAASWIPARRATRVDPWKALRAE